MRRLLRRLLAAGLALLAPALVLPAPVRAADRQREIESLVEECRSADLFFRERAEGELRQRGTAGLAAVARALEDPDRGVRLRLWRVFRDLLKSALDVLDADAGALIRERVEQEALTKLRGSLPKAIADLRKEVEAQPAPGVDGDEERRAAAEKAEKLQKLRVAEEMLRDAEAKIPELEARLPERAARTEEGRKRIVELGPAGFGPLTVRREAAVDELVLHDDSLLDAIRAGLDEKRILPALPPEGAAPSAAGAEAEDGFERSRYLLSTLWAREIDRQGPLAERARPLLERHLKRTLEELRSGDFLIRERAQEDLFALGARGLAALRAGSNQPVEGAERLASLLDWRIEPRLYEQTGIDFRDYSGLPFLARKRMVIRYARVAGRGAIPTLRLIALVEGREPSLRVRLKAAEALAGPNIRDRTAIRAFERRTMPELLKIPEIAREFALINGIQLMEEKRYGEAVEEFKKILDETPYDFQANYRIGFTYLLMKSYGKAILHFEIARRVQPGDDLTLYNLCCAYSLDGQVDKALEALGAAVKAGFTDYHHMELDPDLGPLRTDPRYHELIDRLKQGEAEGKKEGEGEGKEGGRPGGGKDR